MESEISVPFSKVLSLIGQVNVVLTYLISVTSILISSSPLCLFPQSGIFLSRFTIKILRAFHIVWSERLLKLELLRPLR